MNAMKTLILILAFSFLQCQALPVQGPNADDEEIEFVSNNLLTIWEVARDTFCQGSVRDCLEFFEPERVPFGECNQRFYLEPEALCYVYERYIDHAYSVLTTPPDSPLYTQYTANQYVTWKSLNSTCSWVRSVTGDRIVSSCTLPEIKQACNQFRLYGHKKEVECHLNKHVSTVNAVRESEDREAVSSSVKGWLEDNLHPESISSTLLETTGCTFNSNEYRC